MTGFRLTSLIQSRTGRFVAYVLFLMFAARAAVPAGYMPEMEALRDGQVQIVICTGAGTQALLVDESGHPVDDQERSGHSTLADCAFATATAVAFALPMESGSFDGLRPVRGFHALAEGAVLTPPAQGPPLGPRAPPILLG